MKNTDYYKTGKLKENALLARVKGTEKIQLNKLKRIEAYNISPSKCLQCKTTLLYQDRKKKFCNSSCAAIFNNQNRSPRTIESKLEISRIMKEKFAAGAIKKPLRSLFCSITWHSCSVCNKIFYTRGNTKKRKTCGNNTCITHLKVGIRPYKNGRRKIFYYYNTHQNQTVLLESTWEINLAKWLDNNNIVWIRPNFVKWYDEHKQKERLYYPDFYLPKYNIYLDPKNPTAMKIDAYKMSQVEKIIPIIYGSVKIIQEYLMVRVVRIELT